MMMLRNKKIFIIAGVVLLIILFLLGIWNLSGQMVDATPRIENKEKIDISYKMPNIESDDYHDYENMKAGNLIFSSQRMFEQMGYRTSNDTIAVRQEDEKTTVLIYRSWVFTYHEDKGLVRCTKSENPTRQELEYMGDRYTKQGGEWVWSLGE